MTNQIANPNTEEGKTLRGLSLLEVKERVDKGLVNRDAVTCTKTVPEIIKSNLLTPFHAINILLAILVLLAGSLRNALFMGVVISNAAIGIFQELRAKKQVDKLAILADSGANVVRCGTEQNIPKGEVVLDDILHLTLGSQVICDCEIVSGVCEADESLLTGEADPVTRGTGDILSSGSFVVSGDVCARVIHVGADNYAEKLAADAGGYSKPKSEILKSINLIIQVMAIVMLPIGIALFCRQYFALDIKLEDAIIATVAALVGMIPEGLVLLTSVVLAVGTVRLAHKNALVQELYSIEMLARVDVLCLDKTGTLTEGKMKVERVIACSEGEAEVASAAAAVAYGTGDKNPTADAIRAAYEDPHVGVSEKVPFSSIRKWSSVTTDEGTYTMGSGEHIFGADWANIPEAVKAEELAAEGYRVITVTKTPVCGAPKLLGFLLISDVVRESAAETLKYFVSEGVDIKVISGDDPVTVSHIAKKAGLSGAEKYIDMSQVEDCDIPKAALTYKVFGRVSPMQKAEIIRALQSEGTAWP
ncbi:MAG: HAD-IC family P-type ATPase [Lachnospiraceae bacterium]|nr:HAD-IC family P-type ATPase [Candidatus Minthocola equi]